MVILEIIFDVLMWLIELPFGDREERKKRRLTRREVARAERTGSSQR